MDCPALPSVLVGAGKRGIEGLTPPFVAVQLALDDVHQGESLLATLRSLGSSQEACLQAVVRPLHFWRLIKPCW